MRRMSHAHLIISISWPFLDSPADLLVPVLHLLVHGPVLRVQVTIGWHGDTCTYFKSGEELSYVLSWIQFFGIS